MTATGPSCQEGLIEVARGLVGLTTALFFFVWSGFDWVIFLAGLAIVLSGGHLFLRTSDSHSVDDSLASQLRAVFGPIVSGWRLVVLLALLAVLAFLGMLRIAALGTGGNGSAAGSDIERWLPLLLSSLVPLWFVISGLLNRLPRHLLAGIISAIGAVAGLLLGLAWRDSLALAAAVLGIVLIVDGGFARSRFCRPA